MIRPQVAFIIRQVASSDVLETISGAFRDPSSLLPRSMSGDEFSFTQRYADSLFRFFQDIHPEEREELGIYLVQWFGTNVPRGVTLEGKRIDELQHGKAYHHKNPKEPDATKWEWEEVGKYVRIYDGAENNVMYSNHGMLLLLPKDRE